MTTTDLNNGVEDKIERRTTQFYNAKRAWNERHDAALHAFFCFWLSRVPPEWDRRLFTVLILFVYISTNLLIYLFVIIITIVYCNYYYYRYYYYYVIWMGRFMF